MKEAKQWVGVSWTKPFSPYNSGRDGGRRVAEALLSRLFPAELTPCGCHHQARLRGHWSPSGNETSHTQGTIWSGLLSISHSVFYVSNLLSVLAEAPLVVHGSHHWHSASLEILKNSTCMPPEMRGRSFYIKPRDITLSVRCVLSKLMQRGCVCEFKCVCVYLFNLYTFPSPDLGLEGG